MKWFRLYTEARNDAKLRHLTDLEHRIWFNLLCFSAEQEERGTIPVKNRYLLAVEVAGGDDETLGRTIEKLQMLDIVEVSEDSVVFSHFAERQYDNPSDHPSKVAQRVAKHRAKKKNEEKTKSNDNVTKSNETDTDTDTDTESDKEIVVVVEGVKPDGSSAVESHPPNPLPDPKFARAYRAFESQFYQAVNDVQVGELGRFIDLGMDPELIEEAIQITRKKSKDLGYFWGILEKCEQQGLLTMKSFQEAKQQQRIRQQGGQAYRKTDLPEYVAKQPQSNQGTVAVLNPEKKKEAARLMLALGEITQQEFDAEWGVG